MNLGEITGYSFQSRQVRSQLYLRNELANKMAGNQFADLTGPFSHSGTLGLALPERTDLEISFE